MTRQLLRFLLLVMAISVLGFSCRTENSGRTDGAQQQTNMTAPSQDVTATAASPQATVAVPVETYEVVNAWPHDRTAFTQGLVFHDGLFLESTGQYGASSLRRVEPQTGRVLKKVDVPRKYFAEGLTLFQGKLYQLTWTTEKGFVYDPETFQVQSEFSYDGEGWGLTHDGHLLILSDGTNQIRFLDPSTFEIKKTISVVDRGQPLRELNELEYVRGEIYANIWHTDRIVRIDPNTGKILGWIDLTGLLPAAERGGEEAVLNGIAYDEATNRLFVTGKLWPKLFEIRLKNRG
ncbi:MAG TPA: glutaminyl-peptide cyclotransferase [Pyrinomonadaceae bacterium]|jgi:glutamine cyclotransferase